MAALPWINTLSGSTTVSTPSSSISGNDAFKMEAIIIWPF
jgi:hypothetical protein